MANLKSIQVLRRFSFDEWGGTESVVWNSSQSLAKLGFPTEIACTSALDQIGQETRQGLKISRFNYFYPHFPLNSQNRLKLDKKGGNPYAPDLFNFLKNCPDVDIFHCHTMQRLANTVRRVSHQLNKPYVVSFHGGCYKVPQSEIDEMMKPLKHTVNYGKFLDLILGNKHFLDDASGLICVGYDEFEATKKHYPDKPVIYLPNGVFPGKFSPSTVDFRAQYNIPADRQLILCVSRIDRQKNQKILLELLAQIRPQYTPHLVLIGPPTSATYLEEIETFAQSHELTDQLTLIPGLQADSPELIAAYNSADLFILPSIHEPFGIVALEAWAAKCPVIASRVGGLGHLIKNQENGLLFESEDLSGLKAAYQAVTEDRDLARRLAENGHHEANERYSWEKVAQMLADFYEEVIRRFQTR